MELVNGYYCRNCADAELAKKGVDPLHPKRDAAEAAKNGAASSKKGDPTKPDLGVNRPQPSGDVGRNLDLHA